MKLKHKVTLVVGDWSGDGHNQEDKFVIESNLTSKEIDTAYQKGCKVIGFNLSNDVCDEYEDNKIREPEIQKLVDAGFEWETGENGELVENGEDGYCLMPSDFVDIYLFFVKTGKPEFEYNSISDQSSNLNIGGYGLFY